MQPHTTLILPSLRIPLALLLPLLLPLLLQYLPLRLVLIKSARLLFHPRVPPPRFDLIHCLNTDTVITYFRLRSDQLSSLMWLIVSL